MDLQKKMIFKFIKRFFDFLFSFISIIFFFPILIILVLISFLIQGSPIFFIHERLGLNAVPFKMIKFRSMKIGPSLSAKDDEKRLTSYGKFLRKTSLDELPVFLNVLKGDMSLVGPRPMPIKYLKRFNKKQKIRMKIKPGLTGLAQVEGRNNLTWEKKFELDVKYIERSSLYLDLKIQ